MATRRKQTVERTGPELLRAWAAANGGAPPGVSGRLRDAAEDLAIAVDRRPSHVSAAISRFGWQAGTDGWPLTEVSRWVETLVRASGAQGRGLLGFDAAVALSMGWADGFLHGASANGCIDPTTGLARVEVLDVRLRQVYEHCAALGVEPDLAYALVVVDASLGAHPVIERNAARVAVAAATTALFNSGETVAADGDRVLILASRAAELEDRVTILLAGLHTHALLRHDPIAAWIERLPARAEGLPRFVEDLTA